MAVALTRAEEDLGGLTQAEFCARAGLEGWKYGRIRSQKAPPTLPYLVKSAYLATMPLHSMLSSDTYHLNYESRGIRFRSSSAASGTREQARRIAARHALAGMAPAAIAEELRRFYVGRDPKSGPEGAADFVSPEGALTRDHIRQMVDGALALRLLELDPADRDHMVNRELSRSLARILDRARTGRPVDDEPHVESTQVRVIRNLCHRDFASDPCAPYMAALVAHELVAKTIRAHRHVYRIGLAGGVHCDAFARMTGALSSPFPEPSGDKEITFVPLTLEPFHDHSHAVAEAVVAQMAHASSALLGRVRVNALSLRAFGFFEANEVRIRERDAINITREAYNHLDIAIFGCGHDGDDSWLRRIQPELGIDPEASSEDAAVTDICLHLLRADGQPLRAPDGREFIGVSLTHLRRLARSETKLALLISSGGDKGAAILAATLSKCANALICDELAAKDVLLELSKSRHVDASIQCQARELLDDLVSREGRG